MEPKLPAPHLNPERAPVESRQSIESFPLPPTPETGLERAEKPVEQQGEAIAVAAQAAPVLPAPIAAPTVPTPIIAEDATQSVSDVPLVASDDDLIEKEWVDKAKKIIQETKDDPHLREQEVGKLQADYLKKRYGKELGASE